MRQVSHDPDRVPMHGAPGERILIDATPHERDLRDAPSVRERDRLWMSESGVELQYPSRLVWPSPWVGHIPFAMWLVDAIRPRVLVELGVHSGNSYCAFLQAVQFLSLAARCYGVDHWRGDEHSDYYDEDVYAELRAYHDASYGTFSTLIRSTFADARGYFADHTVDLLHIDGFHTYDAVAKDFADWLPKMSARGVVLLHDINVRERDFGVWQVWEQIAARYETCSFVHSHGLGIAYVGSESPPPLLRALLSLADSASISRIRTYFARLGTSLIDRFERRQAETRAARLPAVEAALEAARREAGQHAEQIAGLRGEAAEQIAGLRGEANGAAARTASLEGELNASRADVARGAEAVAALQQELSTARSDTRRHVEIVAAIQDERVVFRAEAARCVDEAVRLRRELAAAREEAARLGDSLQALEQALGSARAETARRDETVGALQRELAVAQAERARHVTAVETARSSADESSKHVAALEQELARTREQVAVALAQRERASLLLREQMAAAAALRRELAGLRRPG